MKETSYNILMAVCLALIYVPYLISYWCDLLSEYTGFIYMTVNVIVFIALIGLREVLKRKGIFEKGQDK